MIEVEKLKVKDLLLLKPKVFSDDRGKFFESYRQVNYKELLGLDGDFVQDNVSSSSYKTLRGLHLQNPRGQAKLVQVLKGAVLDVAVDLCIGSPSFARYEKVYLDDKNHHQFFIPKGFAHGFLVLSDEAIFQYKCTDYYSKESELSLSWDDPEIAINWDIKDPFLSKKDSEACSLKNLREKNKLPLYQV